MAKKKKLKDLKAGDTFRFKNRTRWYEYGYQARNGNCHYVDLKSGEPFSTDKSEIEVMIN